MKNLTSLQIYSKYYINLQEKISVNEKRQIHKFIDNASSHQLIALLTEGKLRAVKTIEETLLESKLNKSGLGFLLEINMATLKATASSMSDSATATAKKASKSSSEWTDTQIRKLTTMADDGHMPEINKPLAAIPLAALIMTVGYEIYKKYFDKVNHACKTKTGADKVACVKKFKNDAIKAQISALSKNKSTCSKSKNPKRCSDEIVKKITKLKQKLA